jgi:hypothetical protein
VLQFGYKVGFCFACCFFVFAFLQEKKGGGINIYIILENFVLSSSFYTSGFFFFPIFFEVIYSNTLLLCGGQARVQSQVCVWRREVRC